MVVGTIIKAIKSAISITALSATEPERAMNMKDDLMCSESETLFMRIIASVHLTVITTRDVLISRLALMFTKTVTN